MAWILFEFETVSINSSLAYFCISQAKIETRALKAKRPGFTDERYNETSYLFENGKQQSLHYYNICILVRSILIAWTYLEHLDSTMYGSSFYQQTNIFIYNESLCYFYTNWEGFKKNNQKKVGAFPTSCRPSSPLKSREFHFCWEFSKFFADLP